MAIRDGLRLAKGAFVEWRKDKASRLGAALSYYTIFSLAPLLIIIIAIAGLVLGQQAVEGQLVSQIEGVVGPNGAAMVQTMIANANQSGSGTIATVIGIGTLLLGATGLFGQLKDALNTIWDASPKTGRGIVGLVVDRLLSFSMILVIGFLLIVSFALSAVLSAVTSYFGNLLPIPGIVLQVANFLVSFFVITLLFAMIYKILPDVDIAWRDVWVGAVVTSLLFAIGKQLIGLYLGYSSAASVYGAAGSLVVILLWVYYAAQIFLLGAEFTKVYAQQYGSLRQPAGAATRAGTDRVAPAAMIPNAPHGAEPRLRSRPVAAPLPSARQSAHLEPEPTNGRRVTPVEVGLAAVLGLFQLVRRAVG